MNKQLLWKLSLIIVTGVVTLFWLIDLATTRTEEGMSFIDQEHREQITQWGKEAEQLYFSGDQQALELWLRQLGEQEQTWVSVVTMNLQLRAGQEFEKRYYNGNFLGRDVNWKIHLYFKENPTMEVPFSHGNTSFLIRLPDRMRPGTYAEQIWVSLQIILPMCILALLSLMLYRHIMNPLKQLEVATRSFTKGDYDVRVRQLLGTRTDELSELAETFDQMAERIGEQIINQRQLISDLSHELRTPLTRLDIAVQSLDDEPHKQSHIDRVKQESQQIRKLVDDSLTLAWLENERPELKQESLDLADLLDVLIENARFEFPDRKLKLTIPNSAIIYQSNHRALGQALENIIRNALRFTPQNLTVSIGVIEQAEHYQIEIMDQGIGVPEQYLDAIFQPFFRVDTSRESDTSSFGLGLALARRQISAIGGTVYAENNEYGGLKISLQIPRGESSFES